MTDSEITVLTNLAFAFADAFDRDSVNKLYRQARIWVRFHWKFENACTEEHSWELNKYIKNLRWARLAELEDVE